MDADKIVVRGNQQMARSVYAEGLKQDGILFGINLEKLDGVAPEIAGPGWACWRKPKLASVPKPELSALNGGSKPILLGEPQHIEEAVVITEEEAKHMRDNG
jgi:hypothetical protein